VAIRKIKANSATEDGDYIKIEDHSTRPFGALAGALVGVFVALIAVEYFQIYNDEALTLVIFIVCVLTVLGILLGRNRIVRRVPKSDLVEIKKKSHNQVTVVLDDERVKRQQNLDT